MGGFLSITVIISEMVEVCKCGMGKKFNPYTDINSGGFTFGVLGRNVHVLM
jgi:hypothetical protein